MGMRARDPKRAKRFLVTFDIPDVGPRQHAAFYRQFVFETSGLPSASKKHAAIISQSIVDKVCATKGRLGLGERLKHRLTNFSEGLALGSHSFIQNLQEQWRRKIPKPRSIFDDGGDLNKGLYATRVLGEL